jgi:hypothetical protein
MGELRWFGWTLAVATVCGAMSPAFAGLGDPAAAVARDRATLRADAVTTTTMPMYDRHEMTTGDGASVREFAAHDGTVFAVDFSGPSMPDMKTLLGSQYDHYLTATTAHRGNHHVMTFTEGGLVVTIVKAPRGFTGHAVLPALVPAGADLGDLR